MKNKLFIDIMGKYVKVLKETETKVYLTNAFTNKADAQGSNFIGRIVSAENFDKVFKEVGATVTAEATNPAVASEEAPAPKKAKKAKAETAETSSDNA